MIIELNIDHVCRKRRQDVVYEYAVAASGPYCEMIRKCQHNFTLYMTPCPGGCKDYQYKPTNRTCTLEENPWFSLFDD